MNQRTIAALNLAARGYPVFALKPNSKREYKTGHALDRSHATTEPERIEALFKAHPDHNIGYLIPHGRAIVDADTDRGDIEKLPPVGNTRIETTATNGLHIAYQLPESLASFAGECTWQGIEIKGAGVRMVGAGSTINGNDYTALDTSPEALAPEWLCEAIRQHLAEIESRRRARTESASSAPATPPPALDDERGCRWAEAGLLAECAEVYQAAKGSRFHVLRRAAFKCGQLMHLAGERAAREQLLSASQHYDDKRKVEKVIEAALKAGSLNPRYPSQRTAKRDTRRALAEMVRLCDISAWRGSMSFRTPKAAGKVRAAGVRAALSVILTRAHAANTMDVSMSQRLLAELAHCGKAGAWRALQAMRAAQLIELAEASDGLDSANIYRLTPRGFLSLQRAAFIPVVESCTSQLRERRAGDEVSSDNLSLSRPPVDSTTVKAEAALSLGIFAHRTLGRAAYLVSRALAYSPLTPRQLSGATGLSISTVYDCLRRLEAARMVERGARGEASRLAEAFTEAALDAATEYSTQARSTARKFRHAKERKAWREAIKARQEAAEEAARKPESAPAEDVEPIALTEAVEMASERAKMRYTEPLEALRMRNESSRYWREWALQEAAYATHR